MALASPIVRRGALVRQDKSPGPPKDVAEGNLCGSSTSPGDGGPAGTPGATSSPKSMTLGGKRVRRVLGLTLMGVAPLRLVTAGPVP